MEQTHHGGVLSRASSSNLSEAGHEQAHGPVDPTALARGQEQGFHPLEPLA